MSRPSGSPMLSLRVGSADQLGLQLTRYLAAGWLNLGGHPVLIGWRMPKSTYDIIVLGDDFAGVVAATLSAKRGLRTLLVVSGKAATSYKLGPYTLPTRPLPWVGADSPAMRRVLDELHLLHPLKRRLEDFPAPFQFAMSDCRVDVHEDPDHLESELWREFDADPRALQLSSTPGEISEALDELLSEDVVVPPVGFWDKRETSRAATSIVEVGSRWLSDVSSNPALRCLLTAPGALSTSLDHTSVSPQATARLFHQWRQSSQRLRGDYQTLTEVFLEKFASHNGEVRTALPAGLMFPWGKGKVSGIRLDDGEEIGCDYLVGALPAKALAALAGDKAPKRLKQMSENVTLAGWRYTLNLVVAAEGIPTGMSNTVFYVADPNKPLVGDNAIVVHALPPDDQARCVITVEAVCVAPPTADQRASAFADLRAQLRQRLSELMPFVDEHVLATHSPHETTAAESMPHEVGLDEPIPAQPVWNIDEESFVGIGGIGYQVGFKNACIANSQTIPGLGLEAPFVAGWSAAKLAGAALKGKGQQHRLGG